MATGLNKNQVFQDNLTSIVDQTDNTKVAQFNSVLITTGTTRTYAFPDASSTITVDDLNPVIPQAVVGGSGTVDYTTLGAAITAGETRIFVKNSTTEVGDIALTAATSYNIYVAPNAQVNMGAFQFTYTAAANIKFTGAADSAPLAFSGAIRSTDPTSSFVFNNATFTTSITEFENIIIILSASVNNTIRVVAAGIERYFDVDLFLPNTVDTGIKTTSSNSYINGLRLFGGGGTICENGLELGGGRVSNILFTNAWTTTNEMMTVTSDDVVIDNLVVNVATATPKILLGGKCANIHSVTAALTIVANVAGLQLTNYDTNGGSITTSTNVLNGKLTNATSAVTAANDLPLPVTQTLLVSGNTQINAILTTNNASFEPIILIFSGTPTVKNATAGGAGTAQIFLAGSVDFVAAANSVLQLVYDGTQFQEIARKVA